MPELPETWPELPSPVPEPSLDPSFQASIGGGVPAPAEPVAPVEPVTPGSRRRSHRRWGPAPRRGARRRRSAPAPTAASRSRSPGGARSRAAPAPAPPDLSQPGPSDPQPRRQRRREQLPASTAAPARAPACRRTGPGTGTGTGRMRSGVGTVDRRLDLELELGLRWRPELPAGTDAQDVLEMVAEQLSTAPPDFASPDLGTSGCLRARTPTRTSGPASPTRGVHRLAVGTPSARRLPGPAFAAPLARRRADERLRSPVPIEPRGGRAT